MQIEDKLIGLLQKCRQEKNLLEAKKLHAYMRLHRLDSHPLLGNFLVPMLVDCGSLPDAQHAFDRLPCRNQYSWTSLMSGYIDSGDAQHAFRLYDNMHKENCVKPNRCMFLMLLNCCSKMQDAEKGQQLHGEIIQRGLERDLFAGSALVGNTLVDMYGKCGLFAEASKVFDHLPLRSVVSWNALLGGYAEHGCFQETENCFWQMQLEDSVAPNVVTLVSGLKACGSTLALETGCALHAETTKRGFEREPYVANTLVDMYSKCHSLPEAHSVFVSLCARDTVSWNALIAGFAENGSDKEVAHCFEQMQVEGVFVDAHTFSICLKACADLRALGSGQELHSETTKRGLEGELFVGSTIMDMYAKCGWLSEAQQVFERLPNRDAVLWNTLIAGYAEHGLDERVLNCFKKMQLEGVNATPTMFVTCLKACGNTGAIGIGRDVHSEIRKLGLEQDAFICSILIDMYGKCGSVTEGWKVLNELPVKNVVVCNAMIKACAENHEVNLAVQCFKEMQQQDVKPDSITYTCLLTACSHASLLHDGQNYFRTMVEEHKIEPMPDHYACIVDLFARSGHIHDAERFLTAMQCPPLTAVLMVLLNACKIYGKVNLGHVCFQQLVEANQEDASSYLLMADLYANIGMWTDASKIEETRRSAGAKKRDGSACIELNKRLHEFAVGGDQSRNTLSMLDNLCLHMKNGEYVPYLDLFSRYKYDETI